MLVSDSGWASNHAWHGRFGHCRLSLQYHITTDFKFLVELYGPRVGLHPLLYDQLLWTKSINHTSAVSPCLRNVKGNLW